VKAGYVVIGYSPADCAKWHAHVERCKSLHENPGKRKKPKAISGVLETESGAREYAALVRKHGGEVDSIQPTIK
jgi:hypothetical protein